MGLSSIIALLSICLPPAVIASDIEEEVKVSFIYNFAKFIKWPVSATKSANAPFYICIEGAQPLSGNISLLQDRQVGGHKIEVLTITDPNEWRNCNILFIGDSEARRVADILNKVAEIPVLTISDLPDFVHSGGIIGMKVIDNRVRFDINLAVAQKANLSIDSQLLKLAVEVVQ
ncbi:MAG: YfiR family protein [Methylococcaceae bacterium]